MSQPFDGFFLDPGWILVVHADRKSQRTLQRVLSATHLMVQATADLGQAADWTSRRKPDLLVIEHRLLLDRAGAALAEQTRQRGGGPCLTILDDPHPHERLPALLGVRSLAHLVASHGTLLAEELVATAQKILRRDLFGLEKYLTWGAEVRSPRIENAMQRGDVVDALGAHIGTLGLGRRVAGLARLVADELLANALYHAPVDDTRWRTRMREERFSDRALLGREQVELRCGCDGRTLGIAVSDRFGSLERATVLRCLARSMQRPYSELQPEIRVGGAGMGLGIVHRAASQLIFNLAPGRRTEAIALIDVRYQPAELGDQVASLHIFEEGGSP